MSEISLQEALKKQDLRFYKKSIDSNIIEKFSENLNKYAENVNEAFKRGENEEYFKKLVNSFFENNFYAEDGYNINTKGNIDSAITKNGELLCMIETKTPQNKNEMLDRENINKKALHELIYYYLEETRDYTGKKVKNKLNSQIRTLIATNSAKFFIFSADSIESIVKGNLENYYYNFKNNNYNVSNTSSIYEYIKRYLSDNPSVLQKIDYVYFDMKEIKNDNSKKNLPSLYKILSKFYLLREKYTFQVSSHTLNRKFYNELLYIMGLREFNEKNVKLIKIDQSIKNSIGYQVYNKFINNEDKSHDEAIEKTFELLIIWLNRILFIKLFEGQLISFNNDEKQYHILDIEKIKDFEDLENLFFSILGKNIEDRNNNIFYEQFISIPYLNSALFERQNIEISGINIGELKNDNLEFKSDSILKNKQYNSLPVVEYLIEFLNCYDFSSKEIEDNVKERTKDIIDSSVLGLIFEKINGYKDGSVYTPSQITEYMAQKVVEKNVLNRINNELKSNFENIQDLRFYIKNNATIDLYKKINNIINSITYLDPAVGSGHFLVSLLNRIIFIKYQLGILMYYDSDEPVRDFNIYIEDDTLIIENAQGEPFCYNKDSNISQKMQETLFNEKRIIIEKCLFGADLNGKAVYICQLRLWIELLKSAYYKNHIMQTLPNIDININTGNSLINRINFNVGKNVNLGKQLDLDGNKKIIKKYKESVKKYISEDNKSEKMKIKELIKDFDDFYIHPKIQKSIFEDEDKKREQEDELYNKSLEWAVQYPEILDEEGIFLGFDCIIGNPPYIQLQSMGKESDKLQKMNYKVYTKTGDIYCLFFELAKKLVKRNGIIAYITSNKWIRAGYGEKLRDFLEKELNPELLIDFASIKVFDEATVDTNILFLSNKQPTNKMIACKVKENCLNNLDDYVTHNQVETEFNSENNWIILSDIERSIKKKIESKGVPLEKWEVNINRGILTGYNDAFIISEEVKDKLIEEDPKSAEIIRPILRGRDIKRYSFEFEKLYVIHIPCGFTKKNSISENKEEWIKGVYPSVYNYLVSTEEKLSESRSKKSKGLYQRDDKGDFWWELRSCNYMDDFNKQKIIYPETTQGAYFVLDNNNYYIDKTCFMMTGEHLKYLLGTLSSALFEYAYKNIFTSIELGKSGYQYNKYSLLKLPIYYPTKNEEQTVEEIIDKIVLSKSSDYTKKLDDYIFSIYGITEKEKEEILKFTKNS